MAVTLNASTSSGLVQTADTSGIIELQNNGTTKMTIGSSITMNSGGLITSGTAVASTSGTSIDFTSIPNWVKRITVMFDGVSTNGASNYLVQLGDAGGIENTSYTGSSSRIATSVATSNFTTGFGINNGTQTAAYLCQGMMVISLLKASTNTWCASGTFGDSGSTVTTTSGGSKSLSDVLTQIRITTVNGTDTFDAGTINILYEG